MKKYSDEQLSRLLGEHSCKQLVRDGAYMWKREEYFGPVGCMVQVAENDPINYATNRAYMFDDAYKPDWTPDQFLAWLEAHDLA